MDFMDQEPVRAVGYQLSEALAHPEKGNGRAARVPMIEDVAVRKPFGGKACDGPALCQPPSPERVAIGSRSDLSQPDYSRSADLELVPLCVSRVVRSLRPAARRPQRHGMLRNPTGPHVAPHHQYAPVFRHERHVDREAHGEGWMASHGAMMSAFLPPACHGRAAPAEG